MQSSFASNQLMRCTGTIKLDQKGNFCFKPHTHNRKLSATCWFTRFVHFSCISILFNTIHFINGFSSSVFKCCRRPMKYLTKCLIALTYYANGRLPFGILIFFPPFPLAFLRAFGGALHLPGISVFWSAVQNGRWRD